MKITKDTIATVELKVANKLGQIIEKTDEPMALLIGGYGNTLPVVEAALEGQEKGYATDSTHVHFTDGAQMADLAQRVGLEVEKNYSFPFPRFAGRFFPYNEFCLVARKPA